VAKIIVIPGVSRINLKSKYKQRFMPFGGREKIGDRWICIAHLSLFIALHDLCNRHRALVAGGWSAFAYALISRIGVVLGGA